MSANTKEFNAAMDFITEPTETPKAKREPAKKKPVKKAKAAPKKPVDVMPEVPIGFRIVPEPKTKRLQLVIKESTEKWLRREAKRRKTSVNAMVNDLLEQTMKGG